jgi:Uma2 family endonuclease
MVPLPPLLRAAYDKHMATAPAKSGQRFILYSVPWRTYERLLRTFADRPGVRLTYDRGILELMTLSCEHETYADFLARLIVVMTEELGLPIRSGRSTTLRRRKRQRGLEPDASWWIANEARMRGKIKLDLRIDPPPDLALEVDVSRSSLNRLAIYAALQIPEVWRREAMIPICYLLGSDGRYQVSPVSRSFPGLVVADLATFLGRYGQTDENTLVREFRAWVRQRFATVSTPPAP